MDYKQLLMKYMRHVAHLEGDTFVDRALSPYAFIKFTEEEREALRELDDEVVK